MNIRNTLAVAVSGTVLLASATVPNVTDVTMTQANDRLVTINYTLSDAPAVITVDVQTNCGNDVWASIGGEALWNAMGDVWKKVEAGETAKTITWRPDHTWPDHKIEGDNTRAVVTAWALDNPPDYMVVDITGVSAGDAVRYYPGVDFLPKKNYHQTGAAVTNNPDYKATKILMRKILARGVVWTMGTNFQVENESGQETREKPHAVTLDSDYYIGVFQLTREQYRQVTGVAENTVSDGNGARPLGHISYYEMRHMAYFKPVSGGSHLQYDELSDDVRAQYSWPNPPHESSFLGLLRSKTGIAFDMPSDAQWEFACRAGHGSGYWGDGSLLTEDNLKRVGIYAGNSDGTTVPVGSRAPNDWGLYDMHGNIFEFCLDWFQNDISAYGGRVNINLTNPALCLDGKTPQESGVEGGEVCCVLRGGSHSHDKNRARSARRHTGVARAKQPLYGYRLVCPVVP